MRNILEFVKALFRSDPGKKLLKERDRLYKESVSLQRNGDLRSYATVMKRIHDIEEEYASLSPE